MKIEQVLVLYLLRNKHLNLQGIGTFQLDAAIPDSTDSEKPVIIPADAITFTYDPKVKDEDELIDFIVEHTHKIKPLAASDLDSFLSLGRQFLNIGKPFTLQNLGTLEKINSGALVFKGGQMIAEKIEPQKLKPDTEGLNEQEENLFNDYQQARKTNNGPKALLFIVILLVLGCIGWVIWHYGFNKPENVENITSTEGILPLTDSNTTSANSPEGTVNTDSLAQKVASSDSFTFRVVVSEYYTKAAAEFRLQKLKSYRRNVILYTDDSLTYKIAEPFMLPLSDTTHIMDSLKRYYAKVQLVLK